MKKVSLISGYALIASGLILLNSCQDEPITPNDPNGGNSVDTTWVGDSGGNGNGNPTDSLDWNSGGGGSIDSTGNTGGNTGGPDLPSDSTYIDSIG
jgi:hypothetical protein